MSAKGYADDLPIGAPIDLGSYHVTREEIIAYAQQWDPFDFHTNEDAAASSVFGGLVGSGSHTMAIFQRLAVLGFYRDWNVLAGRTIYEIQLTSPLRPGMDVRGEIEILDVDRTKPHRALVNGRGALFHGAVQLMQYRWGSYFARKPAATGRPTVVPVRGTS
ncbi:MaoC/PaaZ C-terminal domain-containing protein [Streptomyces sp. NPDC002623]